MKCVLINLNKDIAIDVLEDTQFVIGVPVEKLTKKEVTFTANFVKEGVHAEIINLHKLQNSEKLNFNLIAHHFVPNTKCLLNVRGVLLDNAFSKCVGKIIVEPKAVNTDSFLESHFLLVGDNCKAEQQPILEIKNGDVRVSHGVSISKINDENLYYLGTRGLSKSESLGVLMQSFLMRVLGGITNKNTSELIAKKVLTRACD